MNRESGPKMKYTEDTVEIKKVAPQTKKTNQKNKKGKKKRDWSFYAIIICVVVLAIPAAILGTSIVSASLSSRKPLFGNRFEGQYDHEISDADRKAIEASIAEVGGVSSVKTELISGTLRVYLNAGESAKDDYPGIGDAAYAKIIEVLPVENYFSKDDTYSRYDLEVHIFNMTKTTDESKPDMIYYTMIKTSMHDDPLLQFVSDPISQDFVDKLWAEQEERDNPTEVPEVEPEGSSGESEE